MPGTGFLHSIADSMRETSGIKRHDAKKPSADLPEGEAQEPSTVGKIAAAVAGVAGASQVVGWGAHGTKPEKKGDVPSVEAGADAPSMGAGADVSAPAFDASVPAPSVEGSTESSSIEGGAEAPAVEGDLKLPSGSASAEGESQSRRAVCCLHEGPIPQTCFEDGWYRGFIWDGRGLYDKP